MYRMKMQINQKAERHILNYYNKYVQVQSSLSQGTQSAGISDEITCTVSANGEQDPPMPKVQSEHCCGPCAQARQTCRRNGPADAEQQERPAQNPGPCAPTHQHETECVLLQHRTDGARSPRWRAHSECCCVICTCSAALPLGPQS